MESYLQAGYRLDKAKREDLKRGTESTIAKERKWPIALYQQTLAAARSCPGD